MIASRQLSGVCAAAVAVMATPRQLWTEEEPPASLEVQIAIQNGAVVADFDVSDTFSEEFRRRLTTGIRSNMLIETKLFDSEGEAIGEGLRQCTFKLDIWEDQL